MATAVAILRKDEGYPLALSVPAYLDNLHARGHRPNTIRLNKHQICLFIRWLGPNATMDAITLQSITRYQEQRSKTCNHATVSCTLTVIRSFCRWAHRRGLRDDDPTVDVQWPRKPETGPRALTYGQLRLLTQGLNAEPADLAPVDRWLWRRNRRLVYLMLFAGLRRAEVAVLLWGDVDLLAGELWVRNGKGGKDRCLPLHPTLLYELELVPEAERQAEHAVAGKQSGACLHPDWVGHMFQDWMPRFGLHVRAHQLRHTFATEMLRHGADLLLIQRLMGHATIASTQRYLMADSTRLRAAVNTLPSSW